MKKLTYVFVFVLLALISCDNSSDDNYDDLKKENQELKEALAGNAKIEKVEFENGQMILTYTNGVKIGTEIPDVLKGEDGASPHIGEDGNWWIGDKNTGVSASGKEGVGIKEITYDEKTGLLTITLTNDQVSKFVINNNEGDLSATIMEDLNGKYLVKKITMGDIPYAEIEYTDDYQIKKMTSYSANGYQLFKSFEVEKEYENGLPTKIVTRRFAKEKTTKYSDEYYEESRTELVKFAENKGEWFVEENPDGTFYFYSYYYESDGKYIYERYFATKNSRLDFELVSNGDGTYKVYRYTSDRQFITDESGSYDNYYLYEVVDECIIFDEDQDESEKSVKISDNSFKIYSNKHVGKFHMEGVFVEKYYYSLMVIRTIDGSYELGELMNETFSELEYDSNNQIEKIYESKEEGAEALAYMQNYYDGDKLVKTERYNKEGENWVKDATYLSFVYNAQGQLTQTIEHDEQGNEKVIEKIDYDQEGNPTEIFKYCSEVVDHRGIVDPTTGIREYQDVVVAEAGLYSAAKLEYNYTMKNFFGNTLSGLFPELYGFNFNNALKSATISNSINAGAIEYKDFNDGGYPETMEFIGYGEEESYVGQLKIEYVKIEE